MRCVTADQLKINAYHFILALKEKVLKSNKTLCAVMLGGASEENSGGAAE